MVEVHKASKIRLDNGAKLSCDHLLSQILEI